MNGGHREEAPLRDVGVGGGEKAGPDEVSAHLSAATSKLFLANLFLLDS